MQKENIKPLGENVLVKLVKVSPKTKSGIFLPETASADRPQEGKVLAIGASEKIQVKKGQTVIFAKYSGTEIKMGSDECLILKAEDILAVVE
ncbi:MAG: co-chaperone GroES [Candidatus Moranbacteria bacterium]|nr:co-chaperone GroES [Candidatus Moranbacteria bacterium]